MRPKLPSEPCESVQTSFSYVFFFFFNGPFPSLERFGNLTVRAADFLLKVLGIGIPLDTCLVEHRQHDLALIMYQSHRFFPRDTWDPKA